MEVLSIDGNSIYRWYSINGGFIEISSINGSYFWESQNNYAWTILVLKWCITMGGFALPCLISRRLKKKLPRHSSICSYCQGTDELVTYQYKILGIWFIWWNVIGYLSTLIIGQLSNKKWMIMTWLVMDIYVDIMEYI